MTDEIPQAASNCLISNSPQTADISKRLQDIANKEASIRHAILESLRVSLSVISNATAKLDGHSTNAIAKRIGKASAAIGPIDEYLDEQLVLRFAKAYGNVAQFGIGINDGEEHLPVQGNTQTTPPAYTGAQPVCDWAKDLWIFIPSGECHLMMINPTNPLWPTMVSTYGPSTNFSCLESNLLAFLHIYKPGYKRIATGVPQDGELFVDTTHPRYNPITNDCVTVIPDDTVTIGNGDDTLALPSCNTCTYNVHIDNLSALAQNNNDCPVDLDQPNAFIFSGEDKAWKGQMLRFYGNTLDDYDGSKTFAELEAIAQAKYFVGEQ